MNRLDSQTMRRWRNDWRDHLGKMPPFPRRWMNRVFSLPLLYSTAILLVKPLWCITLRVMKILGVKMEMDGILLQEHFGTSEIWNTLEWQRMPEWNRPFFHCPFFGSGTFGTNRPNDCHLLRHVYTKRNTWRIQSSLLPLRFAMSSSRIACSSPQWIWYACFRVSTA